MPYCQKTFRISGKWFWVHAIGFARWQHPVEGRGARFDVPGTCYVQLLILIIGL